MGAFLRFDVNGHPIFKRTVRAIALPGLMLTLLAPAVRAQCVNKYVHQTARQRVSFTLLTGKLTFDEAKQLSAAIAAGEREPLQWIAADGKVISQQFGDLKVVRPMPVACDDKSSGVVVQATFPTASTPGKIVRLDFGDDLVVDFIAQGD